MVTETGSLRGSTDSTGKNSTEYREYISSVYRPAMQDLELLPYLLLPDAEMRHHLDQGTF